MKKLLLLFSIASLSMTSFGQIAVQQATNRTLIKEIKSSMNRTPQGGQDQVMTIDTIWTYYDRATGLTLYNNTAGGYVSGTANYGHDTLVNTAIGCHFSSVGSAAVTKVLFFFGGKEIVGSSDTVKVGIYTCAADSSPATLLGIADLKTSNMDTSGFLTSVVVSGNITSSFLVTLEFIGTNDTFGVVTSDPSAGDGAGENRARLRINSKLIPPNGSWRSISSLYGGFNADLMIFPVVDDATGLGEFKNELFTLKAISPVPSTGLVSLKYSLVEATKVSYSVMDMTGKVVLKSGAEMKAPADYNETIDMTSFAAGQYFVTFNAGIKTLTQQLVISK